MLCWWVTAVAAEITDDADDESVLTFALVPKSMDNPFFQPAEDGCRDQERDLGIKCIFVGTEGDDMDGLKQAELVTNLIDVFGIQGLAISVVNVDVLTPVINRAVQAGIPVVTFDSDAPSSMRSAYVGTDNKFLGTQIAKLLRQLHPNGGTFSVVASAQPNIVTREAGFREELLKDNKPGETPIWTELLGSPSDAETNVTLALEQVVQFAQEKPDAIVPMMGAPMRADGFTEFVKTFRKLNITLVSGDAMPNQLAFLERRYVDGLVGQLPYEMGYIAMHVLHDIVTSGKQPSQEIYGTNVATHIMVPLILPKITVDNNLIGNLVYTGYILFAMIAIASIAAAIWTYKLRKHQVVKISQPMFLIMIAIGVLVMGSSIIPLSFDDNGQHPEDDQPHHTWICMSTPWLGFFGFTTVFTALFSKTLRVNKIFHSRIHQGRLKVTELDVLLPGIPVFVLNFIVLVCWSVLDPLTYTREANVGLDGWMRVISTYGVCRSDNAAVFLIPLAVINFGVLILANWQAYKARAIRSEFSESKYIAITMASLLQAGLSGIPLSFVVRDMPQAFYLVVVFMIFITCMAVLLLIFVPKLVLKDNYNQRDPRQQRRLIRDSIQVTQRSIELQRAGGGSFRSSTSGLHDNDNMVWSGRGMRGASSAEAAVAVQQHQQNSRELNFNQSRELVILEEDHLEDNGGDPVDVSRETEGNSSFGSMRSGEKRESTSESQ